VTVALREALEGSVAPGHEALLVRGDPRPFALVGRWGGGGALVGSEPIRHAAPEADPFDAIADAGEVRGDVPPGFVGGGWVGYLGYALTAGPAHRPRRLPPFALAYYDHLLHLDADGQWWFEALWTPERDAALAARRAELAARLREGRTPGPVRTAAWEISPSRQRASGS
jgi:para-aminobenzoate synthetase / 4-amino-4-deoxychorismate lyase